MTLLDAPSAARIGIEEDTESTWPWLTSTKLAVSLLKGTSTSCSLPLDLQIEAIGDSTGRGGFTAPAEEDDASSSGSIRRLRAQSGLSWEQLARLFAVSRRSVHKWSNGGPLNAHHMERLAHITQVVDSLGVDPASVRPKLLVSMAGGITLYQQLIQEVSPATNRREGYRIDELIGARRDGETTVLGELIGSEPLDWPNLNS